MGKDVREFYEMTLLELTEAMEGFTEQENARHERYLEGVRLISFYALIPHVDRKKSRIRKPADLFKLEADAKIRKIKNKDLKPVEVEIIYKEGKDGKQSNG